MTSDFEEIILDLVELFEDRGFPTHKQISAALGFAAYLVATEHTNAAALAKHSMTAFEEMVQAATKSKS